MDKWYCEEHPEFEMGHDGCTGAGIIEEARYDMAALQRRLAMQKYRELKRYFGVIISALVQRVKELETINTQ